MKKIVLISCVSEKLDRRAKAEEIYISKLFKYSLKYAKELKADNIYILSALHHLLELDKEIDPYNVTLSYVSPKNKAKKPDLKVLTKDETRLWGKSVIQQISEVANIKTDCFIILAGQSYVKPIKPYLSKLEEPMSGLRQGQRIPFLKKQCSKND